MSNREPFGDVKTATWENLVFVVATGGKYILFLEPLLNFLEKSNEIILHSDSEFRNSR